MKKFFTILSLVAFLLMAINIDASPPRDDASKKVELSANYDVVTVASITIQKPVTIYTLKTYVVDIGTEAISEPMKTDYGNMEVINSEFRCNGGCQTKYNPENNYYLNYNRENYLQSQNNKGFSCGAMGDRC